MWLLKTEREWTQYLILCHVSLSQYLIWMILEGESSKSPLHLFFRWLLEEAQHPRIVLPLPPHIAKLAILLAWHKTLPSVSKAFRDPPATHGPALTPIIHSAFCIIHDAGTCFASVAWGQRIPDFEPGELPFLNFPRSSFGIKAVKGIAEYNIRPTQGFHTLCQKLWTDHRFSHL